MISIYRAWPVWLAAVLLNACGGGSGAACSGGFGGATLATSTANCPGCQVNTAGAAIDDDGNSAADVVFNNSGVNPNGGQVSLRASGRNYPAGRTVGAFMRFPRVESGPAYSNISASFITYLGGVQQEMIGGTSTTVGNIDGSGQVTFYGGGSTLAFDAVEAIAALEGTTQPATVKIFEICGRR